MTDRDQSIFKAKVAEQAECFDEMVTAMKRVVQLDANLSVEERNLLSIAYKNLIGGKRTAWRIISSLFDKEKHKDPNSWKLEQMKALRDAIEKQLHGNCAEILDLIDNSLLPAVNGNQAKVFWSKMKGDYFRYIAEFERDDKRSAAQGKAFDAYQLALNDGKDLPPTDPILLGLALNFSVFYYEIMNDKDKACEMAKKYFDAAIPLIEKLTGDEYKDTTLILQLLRDNLSLWTASESDDDSDD
jgi:14-3-3 protein epsilon